jgi:hypothetical protein
MSTFTGSELEFLAGLNKSWWGLYWGEVARLLRGEDRVFDARQEGGAAIRSKGVVRSPTAKILAFTPRFPGCEDATCPFRRRGDGNPAAALQRRVELATGKR